VRRQLTALLVVAGVAAAVIVAVRGDGGDEGLERAPAPAPFDAQQGRPFDEPAVLRSHHGRLTTTFTVEEGQFTVAGVRVRGKSYRRTFIGPTLRVRPGDTIELRLLNRLGEPTNLHQHGFHVSPIGISDNVLRTMPAGSDNAVRLRLPPDMAPGTYWYHAHLHGMVEEQSSPAWRASSWSRA
jgi:suppressor of ftsI